MSAATLTNRALSTKNAAILTTRADEVATTFVAFKNAIKQFSINSSANKTLSSNATKASLKNDTSIVLYQTQKLENALKNYSKLNPTYQEKLKSFINQLYDFRVHMIPRIQEQLAKTKPDFFYKAKRTNGFMQNLRNNITMRKTRPKNIINSTTGQLSKQIEYISIPRLDMVLEDILPERSYSKIHPNSDAATNVNGPGTMFGNTEGGRRKTHKRRHSRRRYTRRN